MDLICFAVLAAAQYRADSHHWLAPWIAAVVSYLLLLAYVAWSRSPRIVWRAAGNSWVVLAGLLVVLLVALRFTDANGSAHHWIGVACVFVGLASLHAQVMNALLTGSLSVSGRFAGGATYTRERSPGSFTAGIVVRVLLFGFVLLMRLSLSAPRQP